MQFKNSDLKKKATPLRCISLQTSSYENLTLKHCECMPAHLCAEPQWQIQIVGHPTVQSRAVVVASPYHHVAVAQLKIYPRPARCIRAVAVEGVRLIPKRIPVVIILIT